MNELFAVFFGSLGRADQSNASVQLNKCLTEVENTQITNAMQLIRCNYPSTQLIQLAHCERRRP